MKASARVVRRWVRALFEAARSQRLETDVLRDLEFAAEVLGDPAVARFVSDPSIDRAAKRRLLNERVSPHATTALFRNFGNLLLDRRREEVLRTAAALFAATLREASGEVSGVVESGRGLAEEDRRGLEAALGKSLGKTVRLESRQVPELVGGVRVLVGHRLLDASVRGRLEGLRERLLSAPLASGEGSA